MRLEDFLYDSGLTAQGCWEDLDDYAKAAVLRFGQLVLRYGYESAQANKPWYETTEEFYSK